MFRDIIQLIVDQTNLYGTQKSGKCASTSKEEMLKFIGMHILMGIANFPSYIFYWSRRLRYPAIVDCMPLKRFEALRRYLHIVDNTTYDPEKGDKLFKIRPLIEAIRNECVKIEPNQLTSR